MPKQSFRITNPWLKLILTLSWVRMLIFVEYFCHKSVQRSPMSNGHHKTLPSLRIPIIFSRRDIFFFYSATCTISPRHKILHYDGRLMFFRSTIIMCARDSVVTFIAGLSMTSEACLVCQGPRVVTLSNTALAALWRACKYTLLKPCGHTCRDKRSYDWGTRKRQGKDNSMATITESNKHGGHAIKIAYALSKTYAVTFTLIWSHLQPLEEIYTPAHLPPLFIPREKGIRIVAANAS